MKSFCVDLELAKELKENRFPQKSYFRYEIDTLSKVDFCPDNMPFNDHVIDTYHAPTSDEILKELPKRIKISGKFNYLYIDIKSIFYSVYYEDINSSLLKEVNDDKLSNALAKMWLYLKKEGYIK